MRIALIAPPSTKSDPTSSCRRMMSTPAARKSVRYDADAIVRMTGWKSANSRMRFSTRSMNVSQFDWYLPTSTASVANAFTT